jgi:hypothetical protein
MVSVSRHSIYTYSGYLRSSWQASVVPRQTLKTQKKIGGSVAMVLPKSMLDRFHLEAGDEVYVVETTWSLTASPGLNVVAG